MKPTWAVYLARLVLVLVTLLYIVSTHNSFAIVYDIVVGSVAWWWLGRP